MAMIKLIRVVFLGTCNFSKIIKSNFKISFLLFLIVILPTEVFSASTMVFSRESGGAGGAPFVEMAAPGGVISKITIRSGKFIDGIQLAYRYRNPVLGRAYGGNGGSSKSFVLRNGEYITEFGGRSGKYVDSIYIKTNIGRTRKWGGNGGSKSFRFLGTKYSPIMGIWGRSGNLIDAIGVVRKSKANGSQQSIAKTKIGSFRPDPKRNASVGGACGKCDSVTNPVFPTLNDVGFWKSQNKRLYGIVRRLAKTSEEFNIYISNTEKNHCNGNIYCEIDTRTDLIFSVMGAK